MISHDKTISFSSGCTCVDALHGPGYGCQVVALSITTCVDALHEPGYGCQVAALFITTCVDALHQPGYSCQVAALFIIYNIVIHTHIKHVNTLLLHM